MQCALAVDLADSYYVGEKEEEEPVFTKTRSTQKETRGRASTPVAASGKVKLGGGR